MAQTGITCVRKAARWVATLLAYADADAPRIVSGFVTRDGSVARIGDLRLNVAPETAPFAAGTRVFVKGVVEDGELQLQHASIRPSTPFFGRINRLIVDTYIVSDPRTKTVRRGAIKRELSPGAGLAEDALVSEKRRIIDLDVGPDGDLRIRDLSTRPFIPPGPAMSNPDRLQAPHSVEELTLPDARKVVPQGQPQRRPDTISRPLGRPSDVPAIPAPRRDSTPPARACAACLASAQSPATNGATWFGHRCCDRRGPGACATLKASIRIMPGCDRN